MHAGHTAATAWSLWPSALWDSLTAAIGVYYWTLRRGYGVLLGSGALFVDPGEQERLTEITLREELVSSRADAEAERDAQAAMLRAVLDSSQSLVYVKDLEGRYLMVNEAFEQRFDVREADLVGRTDEAVDRSRANEWRANDMRARNGILRVEETSTGPGGVRIYESVKFPLRDATCGVSLDVTDLRRALGAAEVARDQAQAQSQVKSRFLASMSHEIRTPMNGVINDILDFSKIEAGRVSLEGTDVALPELVHDVAAILAPSAQGKGLSRTGRAPAFSANPPGVRAGRCRRAERPARRRPVIGRRRGLVARG